MVLALVVLGGAAYGVLWLRGRVEERNRERLGQRLLAPYLLTLEDVPSGWVTAPALRNEATSAAATSLCTRPLGGIAPKAEAAAAFHESQLGPSIVQVLAQYEAGGAERAMGAIGQGVDSCGTWTETVQGTEVEAAAGRFQFPDVGDQAIAYRIEVQGGGEFLFATVVVDTVVWRRGEIISIVQLSDLGRPDPETLRTLVRKADARLPA